MLISSYHLSVHLDITCTFRDIVLHCLHMRQTREQSMPTTSFTTRLDTDLKQSIERIAQFEDRSASWVANRAIRSFVEEREATRELVKTGLELVVKEAQGISPSAVHQWLKRDEQAEFPQADD